MASFKKGEALQKGGRNTKGLIQQRWVTVSIGQELAEKRTHPSSLFV